MFDQQKIPLVEEVQGAIKDHEENFQNFVQRRLDDPPCACQSRSRPLSLTRRTDLSYRAEQQVQMNDGSRPAPETNSMSDFYPPGFLGPIRMNYDGFEGQQQSAASPSLTFTDPIANCAPAAEFRAQSRTRITRSSSYLLVDQRQTEAPRAQAMRDSFIRPAVQPMDLPAMSGSHSVCPVPLSENMSRSPSVRAAPRSEGASHFQQPPTLDIQRPQPLAQDPRYSGPLPRSHRSHVSLQSSNPPPSSHRSEPRFGDQNRVFSNVQKPPQVHSPMSPRLSEAQMQQMQRPLSPRTETPAPSEASRTHQSQQSSQWQSPLPVLSQNAPSQYPENLVGPLHFDTESVSSQFLGSNVPLTQGSTRWPNGFAVQEFPTSPRALEFERQSSQNLGVRSDFSFSAQPALPESPHFQQATGPNADYLHTLPVPSMAQSQHSDHFYDRSRSPQNYYQQATSVNHPPSMAQYERDPYKDHSLSQPESSSHYSSQRTGHPAQSPPGESFSHISDSTFFADQLANAPQSGQTWTHRDEKFRLP